MTMIHVRSEVWWPVAWRVVTVEPADAPSLPGSLAVHLIECWPDGAEKLAADDDGVIITLPSDAIPAVRDLFVPGRVLASALWPLTAEVRLGVG